MRHPKRMPDERELGDLFGTGGPRSRSADDVSMLRRRAIAQAVAFLAGLALVLGIVFWSMMRFFP